MGTEDAPGPAPVLPAMCVVYGSGTFGCSLTIELEERGVDVAAVIDRCSGPGANGCLVKSPESLVELPDCPVLLGVCNPYAKLDEISQALRAFGPREIWSPARVFSALGAAGESRTHYWLTTDLALYERASSDVARARSLLADTRSRRVFDALLAYRTTGAIEALPTPDPADLHYQPLDVPFIDGPVNLLDIGAFHGEIVDAYLQAGTEIASVVAFEPDPANYARLSRGLEQHPGLAALALPLAVGGTTGPVRFSADGTTGAAIDAAGDSVIQCVRIDDVVGNWPTSHVKLDIEGAEPDALDGMTRLLVEQRPRLAVSAYHRPEHLWTLLLKLSEYELGYRFHLRTYGQQTFDSVLYAVPA